MSVLPQSLPADPGGDRARRRGLTRSGSFRSSSIALFAFPSVYVVRAIGAVGYAAGLVGMFAFAVWLVGIVLGHHDFGRYRNPVRAVLCLFWIVSLLSYIFMDRGLLSALQINSANRWLMQLAGMTGVAFLAAECLHSLEDVRRVLRVLSWAAAFCGLIALLQWRFSYRPHSAPASFQGSA